MPANSYKHRRTAYHSLAILGKLSPSRPIDSSPQANASMRNYSMRSAPTSQSLLTLAVMRFFLISRCTRRAHAALQVIEELELSLQMLLPRHSKGPEGALCRTSPWRQCERTSAERAAVSWSRERGCAARLDVFAAPSACSNACRKFASRIDFSRWDTGYCKHVRSVRPAYAEPQSRPIFNRGCPAGSDRRSAQSAAPISRARHLSRYLVSNVNEDGRATCLDQFLSRYGRIGSGCMR